MDEKVFTLYHGSDKIIEKPTLGAGRLRNDFGQGFYCTQNIELAKEWACTSAGAGFANQYSLDTEGMRILRLNSEEYSLLNWIAVLVTHRSFRVNNPIAGRAIKYLQENFYVNVNAYDIVTGYRADDAYFDFADAFLNNAITLEQLGEAMLLGKLGEQIVLKSAFAFNRLQFVRFHSADQSIYYPARKARNDEALQQYQALSATDAEGLYMIDILRQKVKNDDPRIPRNISE